MKNLFVLILFLFFLSLNSCSKKPQAVIDAEKICRQRAEWKKLNEQAIKSKSGPDIKKANQLLQLLDYGIRIANEKYVADSVNNKLFRETLEACL